MSIEGHAFLDLIDPFVEVIDHVAKTYFVGFGYCFYSLLRTIQVALQPFQLLHCLGHICLETV